MQTVVTAEKLNFRVRPDLADDGIRGTLKKGDLVVVLDPHPQNGFVRVSVQINGTAMTGYVWKEYLAPFDVPAIAAAPVAAFPPSRARPPEAHLVELSPVLRRNAWGHPFRLADGDQPTRAGDTPAAQAASLVSIIHWLGVEKNGCSRVFGLHGITPQLPQGWRERVGRMRRVRQQSVADSRS